MLDEEIRFQENLGNNRQVPGGKMFFRATAKFPSQRIVASGFLAVSTAHLGCHVVDPKHSLADIGIEDAFVAGDGVSHRPKLNLSRFMRRQGN